ncbi:MAG: hypothetical protein PHV37_02850 [Candidatus Gastranaerophilales bacterium]|nr:hypothetical protein [Candidatus Gastranaerophilales bacterium]
MKNLFRLYEWDDVPEQQMIGEILIEAGKINLKNLSMALDAQKFQKMPLGEIFILMKTITREDLEQSLLVQAHIRKRLENV